jgi:hypothetical protein
MSPEKMSQTDLDELGDWASETLKNANGWAERAEASHIALELTLALDAVASQARRLQSLCEVLRPQS